MFRRLLIFAILATACHRTEQTALPVAPAARPTILFVTLDTTRADSIGPEARGVETPAFNALAARALRFRQAYAAVPQTLPSHTSMLTGLLPAGHGVHENGRYVGPDRSLLAERLHAAGYRTAAFVSAFALARRFGLARGFDTYDDQQKEGLPERSARETTDRAVEFLQSGGPQPLFLWVHYYDPHFPYSPPEPYRSRFRSNEYLGEIASMDEQLGRLIRAFEQKAGTNRAIVIVGDHGEGLGEHGEAQHGNLLYQSTMHVPLLVLGPGIRSGVNDTPVSTRRVFDTMLEWATGEKANSLSAAQNEVVVGEAMKPFLDYGWQPQVMAVDGRVKTIAAGRIEMYDVIADPQEFHDLAASASPSRAARAALHDYPVPSLEAAAAAAPVAADDESRRKLASLGYVAAETKPVIRKDAPRPVDMAPLFETLDHAGALFVREKYAEAIPLLEKILASDSMNLDAALHLAVAHASLGHRDEALKAFMRAQAIAPSSSDVRTYLALFYVKENEWAKAAPLLEEVVAREPDRLPALEALAMVREHQGRLADAVQMRRAIFQRRVATAGELAKQGEMAMTVGDTNAAIEAFEKMRATQGATFRNDLELGVLYLASNRYEDARAALDRVPPSHPDYAMALFKRAQVSVLLHEADAPQRIAAARAHADATTRQLIERERLFH